MKIGTTIRGYRLSKGLSQGDIEKRTGLLRCYLSRVENGHTVPSLDTLAKIAGALERGEMVKISSFGSFAVRQKGQRVGRNPKTGQEVPISPRRVLVFRASHTLKDQINSGLAEAEAGLAGEAAVFAAFLFTDISWLWYNVIGCAVVMACALAITYAQPPPAPVSLTG